MTEPPKPRSQAHARQLPRRFYTSATVETTQAGFALRLDGRTARTPAKRELVVPTASLGAALAAEWARQTDVIDPTTMPLTRLVTTAIDAVTGREDLVRAEIVKYAGTDMLCYRADGLDGLVQRQAAAWDPLLAWAHKVFGASFVVTHGLVHVAQPAQTAGKIATAVAAFDALPLAALHTLTTLTGSTVLALAVAHGQVDLATAWTAAHIDEDWQIEKWGGDAEAEVRRAYRLGEATAASLVLHQPMGA